jgi:hypothetical protein
MLRPQRFMVSVEQGYCSAAGIPAGRVRLRTPGSGTRSCPPAPDASKCWFRRHPAWPTPPSTTPRGTDHAAQTRVSESLRATSGFAVRRRAPNGRRQPASPRPRRRQYSSARDVPGRRRLRKHHFWRSGKSGVARVARRVPRSAFELWRSSSDALCRLTHGASSQLLLAARAAGTESELDFRCAAPAVATRHVACSAQLPATEQHAAVTALGASLLEGSERHWRRAWS